MIDDNEVACTELTKKITTNNSYSTKLVVFAGPLENGQYTPTNAGSDRRKGGQQRLQWRRRSQEKNEETEE